MTRGAIIVLGSLIATACGPKEKPASTPPTTELAEPTATAEGSVLVLGDAKLFEVDEPENAFIIAGNGDLMLGDQIVATLSKEGTITMPDGTVVLEVKDDAVLVDGETSGLTLTAEGGTIVTAEKTVVVAFEAGGVVSIDPSPDNPRLAMGHEGCEGDMVKTCMAVMYALLTPQPAPTEIPEGVELPTSSSE